MSGRIAGKTAFMFVLLPMLILCGCGPKKAAVTDPTRLETFVRQAKASARPVPSAEGSLWVAASPRSDLFSDFKARFVNDVVTIRVVETTQADVSADNKNSKSSSATNGFDAMFGLEKKIKELPNVVSGKGSSSFEGKGSTTRATTLQTTLTARVIDVLPNGNLVVEGMREVRVNNENQTVYLTGIVRPEDISRGNVVPSSAVAQMVVRVHGRGAVSQPLRPGWLYQILSGILPF
ncbi:MAG TPA: flagellar basal body L-ring protein FlgH [Acidobacteriota bacterium]|nr:flagellar basal body L-ring protein FlgH [Acidobacteriota bacterium]